MAESGFELRSAWLQHSRYLHKTGPASPPVIPNLDLLSHTLSSQTSVSLLTLFPLLRVLPLSLLPWLLPLKIPFHMKLSWSIRVYCSLYFRKSSLVAQWWRTHLQGRGCWFDPWVRKIPWRRKWQLTPVSLPGESYGQRRLAGYNPWGLKRVKRDLATTPPPSCFHNLSL